MEYEIKVQKSKIEDQFLMSKTRVKKAVPIRSRVKQIVVKFDAEKLKAPFLLRCGAVLIDYILLISIPVVSILLARYVQLEYDGSVKLLNSEINNTGWLIFILMAITNFAIFPMFTAQTVGKMLTGLRIVKTDGNPPSIGNLFLRHFIGYPLTLLTGGLGLLLAVFNEKGRALHDFIAGTIVIYGRKKVEKKIVG